MDQKLLAKIEEQAQKWDISAVLLLEDRSGFRYEKAFGYADRAARRLLTVQDRFCLDTENGFFLTLCILHLMERKLLRLGDKISRFLPEYRHGDRITVRNLLRWQSGIEDDWRAIRLPALQKEPEHAALDDAARLRREYELFAQDRSFQDVLQCVGELELKNTHGRENDDSTSTVPFLSEIIRRVSGMTPLDYLFRHFFEPLGMRETRPGNDATTALSGILHDTELVPLPQLSPSGAFTTTARDLNRLARALVENRLFSPSVRAQMLQCKDQVALGFYKRGELYIADFFPNRLRDTCQICLNFEEGDSLLLLNSEEMRSQIDENRHWRSFPIELRRAWQDARVYPQAPTLKRVNAKTVWDALDIELLPEQLAFIPECAKCVAVALAWKQQVYVLMDHGMPIGMVALRIKPKEQEYLVAFLQVDHRYQGRGYGRILLTRAVEILKEKGATKLTIGVNRFNIPAQRLYRSVGFVDSEVYDDFIDMKMEL